MRQGVGRTARGIGVTAVAGVWIFGDLPLGQAAGPSYMLESWARELGRQGLAPRTFTPAGGVRGRRRDAAQVTFRSLRHVGYPGDHHARYSTAAELVRARRELPDVVVVATLGRVGVLGLVIAAFYGIPLVVVVSTDTTSATAYYSAARAVVSGGLKPALLAAVSPRARAAFLRRPGSGGGQPLGRLVARITAALHADADEVVLLSAKGLSTYGGACSSAHVTVIPAGIDRLPAGPVPPELAWRPGALRVLYVGRFAPEKNVLLLVQALRLALDRGVDAQLALVGEGPLRERLVAEADRLGVADRVVVVGPFPRAHLGGVYAGADVFAFPSVADTQAFVLNEAAHEALPLLVSDTVNGVVAHDVSALVVPPDPARYAQALARLGDRELRQRLGTAARELAQRLGEAAQCARLADVIGRAAGWPPAPARAAADDAPAGAEGGPAQLPAWGGAKPPAPADASVTAVARTR